MSATEKSWVWYSDKDSRAAGKVSVLAVAETVLAVAFFWWLAARIDTALLLVVSPIVAFLVLLRSTQSIAEGVKLFEAYTEPESLSILRNFIAILLNICVVGVLSYHLVSFYIAETNGSISYQQALLIGVAMSSMGGFIMAAFTNLYVPTERIITLPIPGLFCSLCVILYLAAGSEAIAVIGTIFGLTLFIAIVNSINLRPRTGIVVLLAAVVTPTLVSAYLGLIVGVVFRVLFIRCWATTRYLFAGISSFPRNWYQLNLIEDLCTPPDFVPGLPDEHVMSFSNFRRRKSANLNDVIDWIVVFPLIFLPAILYRFTLKSTTWLYLPVLWMAHVPAKLRQEDRKEVWIKSDSRSWFTLISAISVLGYALYISFDPTAFAAMRAANESQMLTPAHLIWAIDPAGWKLWFWVTLPSAALTIIVWLWVSKIRGNLAAGGQLDWHSGPIRALIALNQVKNALIIAWMLMTLLSVARAGWLLGKLPDWMEPVFINVVLPITNMWSS